ncbi:MAG: hypothetical protein ABSA52_14485 [Candidatus Binatia bacterium]
MPEKRVRLQGPAVGVGKHRLIRSHVQRLEAPEYVDGRIEQLDRAPRARRLGLAVGVQVPGAADMQPAADQVDVSPLEPGGFGGPKAGPEQQLHEGMKCRVGQEPHARGAGPGMAAEALRSEALQDPLHLVHGERVGLRWVPSRPLEAGEDVTRDQLVNAGLLNHRAEAPRDDVPHVLG